MSIQQEIEEVFYSIEEEMDYCTCDCRIPELLEDLKRYIEILENENKDLKHTLAEIQYNEYQ
ncbi:MAG: hypothetical protein ACOX8A_11470 [Thermacetogeniaceae bacterium]|jgi:hypothetical protein